MVFKLFTNSVSRWYKVLLSLVVFCLFIEGHLREVLGG
jgi:hypothetical protein